MMMSSVDLYRSLDEEVGLETGWHEVGSLRLASSQERMEELARQAGWAKTFGLPLDLISAEEAQRAVPADVDRRRARRRLPPDRRLHRPEPADVRARGRRASRRRGDQHEHARDRDRRRARPRHGRRRRTRARSRPTIVVNAGGMFAKELGELAGVNVPIVPMAHEYLVTKPSGLPLEMPTMRDPSLLVYFRAGVRRAGHGRLRARPGAVVARRHPRRLQRHAARRGLAALRAAAGERDQARARARGDGGPCG